VQCVLGRDHYYQPGGKGGEGGELRFFWKQNSVTKKVQKREQFPFREGVTGGGRRQVCCRGGEGFRGCVPALTVVGGDFKM